MNNEPSSHPWQNLFRAFAIEWLLLCALAFVVSLVMTALGHLETFRSLDRSVTDIIMRELARERLAGAPSEKSVRYVFVNVGEATCRLWAQARGEACASGFATPRDELVEMLKALAGANAGRTAMKLVMLDVELAPQAGDKASDKDKLLCAETYSIAKSIPVLAVRPVVNEASNPARPIAQAYPSIFDDTTCSPDASPSSHPDLWFASPLLQPDPDNVVRSVYAWHLIRGNTPAAAQRISGFGLLGAALTDETVDRSGLACLFPASRPGSSAKCEAKPLNLANHVYEPSDKDDLSILRILFSLPSDPGSAVAATYTYAPFVFQTVEAYELQQRLSERPAHERLDLRVAFLAAPLVPAALRRRAGSGTIVSAALEHRHQLGDLARASRLGFHRADAERQGEQVHAAERLQRPPRPRPCLDRRPQILGQALHRAAAHRRVGGVPPSVGPGGLHLPLLRAMAAQGDVDHRHEEDDQPGEDQ